MKRILLTLFFVLALFSNSFGALNFDFTTYTEYDTEFSGTITSSSVAVSSLVTRTTTYYVYSTQDTEDFTVDYTLNYSTVDNNASLAPIVFTNSIGDYTSFGSSNYYGVFFVGGVGNPDLYLGARTEGSESSDGPYSYTLGTALYGTIEKLGSTLTNKYYSDAARTTLLVTQTISTSTSDTYQYIIISSGRDNSTSGTVTGSISDVSDETTYYDLTVNMTGPTAPTWTAARELTYGPFAEGSTQSLVGLPLTVAVSDETGYYKPADKEIDLTSNTTINTRYINTSTIIDLAKNAVCAFPLGEFTVDVSDNANPLTKYGTIGENADRDSIADAASEFTENLNTRFLVDDAVLEIPDSTSFAVSAWFYTGDNTKNCGIASQFGDLSTETGFDLAFVAGSGIRWWLKNAADTNVMLYSTTTIQNDTWYHIIGQWDETGKVSYIYINDSLDNSVSIPTGLFATNSTTELAIGNFLPSSTFDYDGTGRVDDVLITHTLLSSANRTILYEADPDFTGAPVGDLTVTINQGTWTANDGVDDFGPFVSGTQSLPADTYSVSFSDVDGYQTPTTLTGVVVTDGGTTSESATYVAYPTTDIYISNTGTGTGASCSDPTNFAAVNQTTLGPDATIHVCDELKDTTIEFTRNDLILDGDNVGSIDGAKEIETTWEVFSGNIYRTQINISNVDYIQTAEPATPSIGERWYITRWDQATWRIVSKVARIWNGSDWDFDPTWMLIPRKVWLDGVQVNSATYPVSGTNTATTLTTTKLTDATAVTGRDLSAAVYNIKQVPWLYEDGLITSQDATSFDYYELNSNFLTQKQYYISNSISDINAHGEWSYDYNTGWFYIYLDTAPANYTIEYSSVNHGVYANGEGGLTVQNLEIKRTNDSPIKIIEGSGDITITGNTLTDFAGRGEAVYNEGGIDIQGVDPWYYNYVTVINDGNFDSVTRPSNITITNNTISKSEGAVGINVYLYQTGSISNNKVFEMGYSDNKRILEKGSADGISNKGCTGIDIENNIAASIAYAGIQHLSENANVRYNMISNYTRVHKDMGGVHTFGLGTTGNLFSENTFTNGIGSTNDTAFNDSVAGIYLDNFSHDNDANNNEIYRLENSATKQKGLFDNNLVPNTPLNRYDSNILYDDDATLADGANGVFTNNTQVAESTWPTYTLTINYSGNFDLTVDGVTSTYAPYTAHSLPKGAYVITYEETVANTPIDEVISLTANTTLDRTSGSVAGPLTIFLLRP